jgi:hypothetical protein
VPYKDEKMTKADQDRKDIAELTERRNLLWLYLIVHEWKQEGGARKVGDPNREQTNRLLKLLDRISDDGNIHEEDGDV